MVKAFCNYTAYAVSSGQNTIPGSTLRIFAKVWIIDEQIDKGHAGAMNQDVASRALSTACSGS